MSSEDGTMLAEELRLAVPSGPDDVVKNQLQPADSAIHGWYRFVLGYPPHLVREYLQVLGADPDRDVVYDPFCGTATTPVEARLQGFSTISTDANPIAILAARAKLAWDVNLDTMRANLDAILDLAARCLAQVDLASVPAGIYQLSLFDQVPRLRIAEGYTTAGDFDPNSMLSSEARALIPSGFISEKPLLRVLGLRYAIERLAHQPDVRDLMILALANTIVETAGNVAFGPEVYRVPPKQDADVLGAFAATVARIISDLQVVLSKQRRPFPMAQVFADDARKLSSLQGCPPIGIVITSPPYPNEKDYTRSTRLESVLLGLVTTKQGLRAVKSNLLRSNTRNVFVNDDDDAFVNDIPSVVRVADEIEEKRLQLGKTSGFERLYHRVTRLYFGGMYRHFVSLWPHLRPGARCAYVVGDQMSYFRVHIRTAHLLADVARKAGYQVDDIVLWRTRRATATRRDLEENVLILRRPTSGGRDA